MSTAQKAQATKPAQSNKKVEATKAKKSTQWVTSKPNQISSDLLWELTRNYSSYLVKNHGLTLSKDPLNLSGLNTKRDSGIAHPQALGIQFNHAQGTVKEKKAKKKAQVLRLNFNVKTKRVLPKSRLQQNKDNKALTNNTVYSQNGRVTARSIAKALHRGLANYRKDLLPLAFKRLRRIHKFKKLNKNATKKRNKETLNKTSKAPVQN